MNQNHPKARILLVDDVMENIQIAGTILKEKGYRLNTARNGKQALEVVEMTIPDLILLDIMMPEMDGYECCDQLKKNERTKDIPIIFLTAITEAAKIVHGLEHGAVDYIIKPFNASELVSRIKTHLDLRQARLDLESLTQKASRYISPHVFDAIFKGEKDAVLETEQKRLTILFSDIVGFTERTETMGDKELTRWLNDYCDEMAKLVLQHGGTLDKFIGDSVMAFFGDPVSAGVKEDAVSCMAIEMNQVVEAMGIQVRIGVNSGSAYVGNFGTEQQMNYTIIGKAVNAASRLQTSCEPGKILISQTTYDFVKDDFWCNERGLIKVKGFADEIMTYWVNG